MPDETDGKVCILISGLLMPLRKGEGRGCQAGKGKESEVEGRKVSILTF